MKSHIVEAGECLACGHILPFAIYKPIEGRASVGVCAACARLAEPNRGPCSKKRGCGCAQFSANGFEIDELCDASD